MMGVLYKKIGPLKRIKQSKMKPSLHYLATLFYILIVFYSSYVRSSELATLSPEECVKFGYNANVLKCSTCEYVAQVIGENSVASMHCNQCCIQNLPGALEEKYARAILEVDRRSLAFMPEIKAVVDKKKKLNLMVRSRYGSPRLLMFSKEGDDEPSEVLSVAAWKQDTFEDYLTTHLQR